MIRIYNSHGKLAHVFDRERLLLIEYNAMPTHYYRMGAKILTAHDYKVLLHNIENIININTTNVRRNCYDY